MSADLSPLQPRTGSRGASAAAQGASHKSHIHHESLYLAQPPRQVKNRESAARSRQRRADYTAGLEVELEALKDQNRELRLRILQLCPSEAEMLDVDGRPLLP